VCGNGIREPGEQCDGGPLCTAACSQTLPSCCLFADHCTSAPTFSLAGYLATYCGISGGVTPIPGGLCADDGSCAPVGVAAVPTCCQLAGSCYDGSAASTDGLWRFLNYCTGAYHGTMHIGAGCGVDGVCQPQ
jgi:hypothetical protein